MPGAREVQDRLEPAVNVNESAINGHPANGISLHNKSSLFVRSSTISGNLTDGILAGGGSSVQLDGSTIQGNGSADRPGAGISAFNGITVEIRNGSTITSQVNGDGIHLQDRSSLSLWNSTVASNAAIGIFADTGSSALVDGARIRLNGVSIPSNGIVGHNGSAITVVGPTVASCDDAAATQVIDNTADGIHVTVNSSLSISDACVRRNSGSGIGVHVGSVAALQFPPNYDASTNSPAPTVIVSGNGGAGFACGQSRWNGDTRGISGAVPARSPCDEP